ncbi:beta-1,6-N-acetylglucosaminyltransferase [Thioalkalivibrio sulfidiphilus]|uniref:beta-1,6-N-acetylglucosaminyltransferase n=1 Tax=Thioalkalivibrio sulfidiphilus TaxID=1033854 RepID=UPI0009DA1A2A
MIYYEIQAHGHVNSLISLVDTLSHPRNIVSISIDNEMISIDDIRDRCSDICLQGLYVSKSAPLSWGGFSITKRMYESLLQALGRDNWQWYVNLSGQCIPLKSQSFIHSFLERERHRNSYLAYCYGFECKKDPVFYVSERADNMREYRYGRVRFLADPELGTWIESGLFDPARRVAQRQSVLFDELSKGLFRLQRHPSTKLRELEGEWKRQPQIFGRQWVILHRSVVERIAASVFVEGVLESLRYAFISDESFFQKVLYSRKLGLVSNVSRDNRRYLLGQPSNLSTENIREIVKSDALFGRKVNISESNEVYRLARELFP